jgi:hypothetical protein
MKAGAREIGLCERCRHARVVETPRSVFWMCALAAADPRFDKYPRLPILKCTGFEEGVPGTPPGPGPREE